MNRLEQYSRKLEESLSSHHRFPINLEWLVDLFKYKHISSLTTHLKRHFMEKIDYKRIPEGQNKRTWSYHITIDCFSRICHYCRHSERKIVAKYWLRKILIIRRDALAHSPSASSASSSSADEEDEEDDERDDEEDEDPMEDEEEESEDEDSSPEDTTDESTPENSPRYHVNPANGSLSLSTSSSQPSVMNPMTITIPSASDFQYPLDWSYLKLRSYDIASLYHLGSIHTFHHHHHHCYIPSHQSYSSPCCSSQLLSQHQAFSFHNHELFRPVEEGEAREDYPMDTSFDTNAFLSIPDDAGDDESPRSSTDSDN